MKDKCASVGDISKLTPSKLTPIKSAKEFERNVALTAVVQYWLSGSSRRKVQKPSEYAIKLCIILVKEKAEKEVSTPVSAIVCAPEGTSSLLNGSGGRPSVAKRKSTAPPFFLFKANMIYIYIS